MRQYRALEPLGFSPGAYLKTTRPFAFQAIQGFVIGEVIAFAMRDGEFTRAVRLVARVKTLWFPPPSAPPACKRIEASVFHQNARSMWVSVKTEAIADAQHSTPASAFSSPPA